MYSIEESSNRIYDSKTREYFKEVVSSYSTGNYRSATVMLWSVIVFDLVSKLQYLVDMYSDAKAVKIIAEIEKMQKANSRSPEWENTLLDLVHSRTQIVGISEYENFKFIQGQRHLSAHPTITESLELHIPNKETVRSMIRNTLDGLLIKPPLFTNYIVDEFISDIAENKGVLIVDDRLEQYISSKYLKFCSKEVQIKIFRSLWKFVFRTENDDCDNNRKINLKALKIISKKNRGSLKEILEDEIDYYSNIAKSGIPISYLIYYISDYPYLYKILNNSAKSLIKVNSDEEFTLRCIAWFLNDNPKIHADKIIKELNENGSHNIHHTAINIIHDLIDSEEWITLSHNIFNTYYACSPQYADADERFSQVIHPYLEAYSSHDIIDLMDKANGNDQCYDRRLAKTDHKKVLERLKTAQPIGTYELSKFKNFIKKQ